MQLLAKIAQSKYVCPCIRNITELLDMPGTMYESTFVFNCILPKSFISYQDGRVVKALDLTSNGRVVRVGSNPTPGN